MIWLRRIVALPLALVFIILFIMLLVVGRVNTTVGNPDFYSEQLVKADVYNFVYDDVLPSVLDDVDAAGAGESLPLDFVVIKPHLVDLARRTLPPEWLQVQAEAAIGALVPYAVGDADHFALNVPLKDRVEVGLRAFGDMLAEEEVFDSIYDGLVAQAIAESSLPAPFALGATALSEMVKAVIPRDWVQEQLADAIEEFIPYMTGDADHFTIEVSILQAGLTYTDADLRASMGSESQALEDVREVIAEGLVYSDEDLRQAIVAAGGEDEWQMYQEVRTSVGLGRSLFWLLWLVPVVLLVCIGLLGGRNWRSRAIWAAAVLALSAALAYIAFGPVYNALAAPYINEVLTSNIAGKSGYEAMLLGKAAEIAENTVASFISGLSVQAIIVLVVAVIVVLLAGLWHLFFHGGED